MKLNINDEQGIELLHFIFERELKPPFTFNVIERSEWFECFNKNRDLVGYHHKTTYEFVLYEPMLLNIEIKLRQAFDEFPSEYWSWRALINPYLISWLMTESKVNISSLSIIN